MLSMATWPRWEGDAKAGVQEMIEVGLTYRTQQLQ